VETHKIPLVGKLSLFIDIDRRDHRKDFRKSCSD